MNNQSLKYCGLLLLLLLVLQSCKKDFLEQRPNKALLVPQSAEDFRALLDNNFIFGNTPGLSILSDGDLYTTEAGYNAYFLDEERKAYTWEADLFGSNVQEEWNLPYRQIFYANLVLEGLTSLAADNNTGALSVQTMRGEALFHRAFNFYHLAQVFAPPYSVATAATDPGIPLKLSSDVTERTGRGSLEATYQQIIKDLRAARSLLPLTADYKSRPVQAAAYAMLSKTYLSMGDYELARIYADSCLQQRSALINYNTLSTTSTRPFPRGLPSGNDEMIFYAVTVNYDFSGNTSPTLAEPSLYQSYASNDLRRTIFFRTFAPGVKFKGNYSGILYLFSGLATDEMYLVRAECSARAGQTAAALQDLNTLLVTRWRTGTFVPLAAADAEEALRLVLTERRRELTCRGTRWTDLRRLNSDARFAVTLTRTMLGRNYSLEPGSKRYTFPIPAEEVRLNNLQQNER